MATPDIAPLIEQYFVNAGDLVEAPSSPGDHAVEGVVTSLTAPSTLSNCRVTPLIDGVDYFQEIRKEVDLLLAGDTDRFFYTCSWEFGTSHAPASAEIGSGGGAIGASAWSHAGFGDPEFHLGGGGSLFRDDLVQMVAAGVDVRVLAWASPFLVNFESAASRAWDYWGVNMHSLRSVQDLREMPSMAGRLVLNTLGHTLGAMHLKTVVCGDGTGYRAFTAGLDFVQNRNRTPGHGHGEWHDVGAKVEGEGAYGIFTHFANLWNEQIRRTPKKFKAFGKEIPSHTDDVKTIPMRPLPAFTGGKQHIQVLRTVPTMNFSHFSTDRADTSFPLDPTFGCFKRLVSGFRQRKISFAPDGIFEFRMAQKKAITSARRFVYIEDQAFSNFEIAEWINERLRHVDGFKAIFLYMNDPVDGLSKMLPGFMEKVIKDVSEPHKHIAFGQATYTVHAKVTIVDDEWAAVGSANCMRRSFYTDGELSISVLDEESPSFAARLRAGLWADHCSDNHIVQPIDPLLNFDASAGLWNGAWVGSTPPASTPPAGYELKQIALKAIPFVFVSPTPDSAFPAPEPHPNQVFIDQHDADSRLEY